MCATCRRSPPTGRRRFDARPDDDPAAGRGRLRIVKCDQASRCRPHWGADGDLPSTSPAPLEDVRAWPLFTRPSPPPSLRTSSSGCRGVPSRLWSRTTCFGRRPLDRDQRQRHGQGDARDQQAAPGGAAPLMPSRAPRASLLTSACPQRYVRSVDLMIASTTTGSRRSWLVRNIAPPGGRVDLRVFAPRGYEAPHGG
jgi:hypothetical protein